MPSTPFVPASAYAKLIPALNQGDVRFDSARGYEADETGYLPDEGTAPDPKPAEQLPEDRTWKTPAMFKYGTSALVDGAWKRVVVLTVPVPSRYVIRHQDKVTWTGFAGRVVAMQPVGSADLPSAWKVTVA